MSRRELPHAAKGTGLVAQAASTREEPAHPATVQRRATVGRPPHPAIAQARVTSRSSPQATARPPHPAVAQRRTATERVVQHGSEVRVAQPAQAAPITPKKFIGGRVKPQLVAFSEVCLAFAKAVDGTVEEVQAMWYQLEKNGGYELAVSANCSGHDRDAVDAIARGIAAVNGLKGYGTSAQEKAKTYLNTAYVQVMEAATLVYGRSHAEQNLLRWIAPKLTKTSIFHIYGTKAPCTQCLKRLTLYRGLLPYGVTFEFEEKVGLEVKEDAIVDQIEAKALDIPH